MTTVTFHPPFKHRIIYNQSGCGEKPVPTKNVYNSFGVAIARCIDEDTAHMIAEALNNYKPELVTTAGGKPR